jgi:hypothetical protein
VYEIQPWKKPGCELTISPDRLTCREPFSREINLVYGEGGGLNANYRTVEALAIVANRLGQHGLVYGADFVFKTGGIDGMSFDFCDEASRDRARGILADAVFSKAA